MGTSDPIHSETAPAGTLIHDRYEIVRLLGRGGMASTYLVRDVLWDTAVALKLLRTDTPDLLDALKFEFAVLRDLYHPHLCQVHDFSPLAGGSDGSEGAWFYTADYVAGTTLDGWANGASFKQARAPIRDALSALRLLHRAGIRHGDFKPANILVRPEGSGVLIDLGCARRIGGAADATVSGTTGFMAPEVLHGEQADHRADLYAVGVTLLSLADRLRAGLPREADRLARRLVRPDPSQRPSDVDEVLDALGLEPALEVAVPDGIGRLVGRDEPLARATQVLASLANGARDERVVHIVGAEGIGKTRLLRELVWRAALEFRVVETNAARWRAVEQLLTSIGCPPEVPGLSAVHSLRHPDRHHGSRPTVMVIDDAHLLAEQERKLLGTLAETIADADGLLLLVASLPEFEMSSRTILRIELGPLDPKDTDSWLGSALPPRARRAFHALSGGVPAVARAVLAQISSGDLDPRELIHKTRRVPLSERQRAVVKSLDRDARRALGVLAVLGRRTPEPALRDLGVAPAGVQQLVLRGLCNRDAGGFKLRCGADGAEFTELLGAALIRRVHDDVAEVIRKQLDADDGDGVGRAELEAQLVYHLALGRTPANARTRLARSEPYQEAAPRAWWKAAEALAQTDRDDFEVQLQTAALERAVGRAPDARKRLSGLLGRRPSHGIRPRLALELALCELKSGNAERARVELEQTANAKVDPVLAARAQAVLAQALNKQGKYREALSVAERVVAADVAPTVRADLRQSAGVALSFLGDFVAAQERLREATSLLKSVNHPRRLVRTEGTQGLVAYQLGDLNAASEHYRRALDLAERHSLSDQVATAALNLGTVCHQRAQWSEALDAYERGMATAAALGQVSTEALLRFNLAKLYADLGRFERAELNVQRCQQAAERAELPLVRAEAEAVRGEVYAARGSLGEARQCLVAARSEFERHESRRERAEVDIQLAELAFDAGDLEQGCRSLDETRDEVHQLDARDVRLRWSLAQARRLTLRGAHREAAERAEAAAREARAAALAEMEAEAEQLAARCWDTHGSAFLARTHWARARELWERAAATLPAELRETFLAHPRRAGALQAIETPGSAPSTARQQKLQLLLDINKRLNSSLKTSEILERTMDTAIQLTGAERGFILLTRDGEGSERLHVAVARNLDQEQLDRSHLKFSRAIAEQVVGDGMPVITANAQTDSRFSQNESVHAMQLQSVVCVPVLSPSGTLGALYLDNRFQPGRFRQADIDLLLAFSDQVAIALLNARLHDELRARNRELQRERRRVEQLAAGQAAEIERLNEQMRKAGPPLDQRYDYRGIVGSSPALRRVFALLDRVIETDLPILIQGESGTGKELFARAIHRNNQQRHGPIVSVNCAALPETLLESELFGYERGAFTGADRTREGLFVTACSGSLFLDEVAEMPLPMQVKLLRALQEREVRPLGSHKVIPIDIRLVCATNRRLQHEVEQGRFRADLYYRIAGVEVTLPPLRERAEDIPVLVHHLVAAAAERMGRPPADITPAALRKLAAFRWPGNVRQLENAVTKALVMCERDRITAVDIELPDDGAPAMEGMDRAAFEEQEAERIAEALAANRWNVAKVSRLLAIPRPTLYRKLRRYGLNRT